MLVSGGVDTTLVLTPCATPDSANAELDNPLSSLTGKGRKGETLMPEAYYQRSTGMNGVSSQTISVGGGMVVCLREKGAGVWRVRSAAEEGGEKKGGWDKVLEMELKVASNLISGAISQDGSWLALSDLAETRLFKLEVRLSPLDIFVPDCS